MVDFLAKLGLDKLDRALMYGVALALILAVLSNSIYLEASWISFFVRLLHVLSGVMWVGLLWYFNFVQIPSMPKIPDEQKPAISKVIAPTALFWFRWAALATLVTGLLLAVLNGYIVEALTLTGTGPAKLIGIGMWLGIVMAYNVWMIIWPNQKIALGNTMFSIPMLYFMVGAQNIAAG
jgi:uncharacterized membrane protein